MSAFQETVAEFLRLQAVERGIADEDALPVACNATDAAFAKLIALPAENIGQAAAKLAALASQYDVPGCGCSRPGWAMLVAEVCRYGAAGTMKVVA